MIVNRRCLNDCFSYCDNVELNNRIAIYEQEHQDMPYIAPFHLGLAGIKCDVQDSQLCPSRKVSSQLLPKEELVAHAKGIEFRRIKNGSTEDQENGLVRRKGKEKQKKVEISRQENLF